MNPEFQLNEQLQFDLIERKLDWMTATEECKRNLIRRIGELVAGLNEIKECFGAVNLISSNNQQQPILIRQFIKAIRYSELLKLLAGLIAGSINKLNSGLIAQAALIRMKFD